jgi:hypothetical protein
MTKAKITQDALYEFMLAHNMIFTRLGELIGRDVHVVTSRFMHREDRHGNRLNLNSEHIELINKALPVLADKLYSCVLTFGSSQVYTSKHYHTYDPALVDPLKEIGKYINITRMLKRILGWSVPKINVILSQSCGPSYGHITRQDAERINIEILAIAGVLSNCELVMDGD